MIVPAGASLQAAYNALPATGGVLEVSPGRYDVGPGLNLSGKPVRFTGLEPPPPYVPSTSAGIPRGAVLYSSLGAPSLVKAGAEACQFIDLGFEFTSPTTVTGIEGTKMYGQVEGCYFFATKTANPAAVGVWVYTASPGVDSSWWRITKNARMNMAIARLGSTAKGDCNRHLVADNVGFGLAHTRTDTSPGVEVIAGHGCWIVRNNHESEHVGIKLTSCWQCEVSGAGEFVDIFVDAYDTKGCLITASGIPYTALGSSTPIVPGALLVRGDQYTRWNRIIAGTGVEGGNQRLYPPSAIQLAGQGNVIV